MSVITRARRRLFGKKSRSAEAEPAPLATSSDALADSLVRGSGERKVLSDEQLADWQEQGYLVLPRFMPHGRVREINGQMDALWRERKKDDHGLVIDVFTGSRSEKRIPFAKATDRGRAKPYRLNDLYLESELVRETLLDPELVEVLDDLLEGAPIICNSLSMERGCEQRPHVDTFYVAPPEPGKMVGAMVLLEDTKPAAGPFRFFPGSHKIPPFLFSDGRLNAIQAELGAFDEYLTEALAERELAAVELEGNAGDVILWHPQMVNGGTPIEDLTLTNKAVVAHYWRAKDVDPDQREDIGGDRYYMKRPHQPLA
jgi:ectoine hydroxylase-related dioxygenase (phytanoyl-CoA dioxygenase family)